MYDASIGSAVLLKYPLILFTLIPKQVASNAGAFVWFVGDLGDLRLSRANIDDDVSAVFHSLRQARSVYLRAMIDGREC